MSEIWWDVVGVGENSMDRVLRLPALPTLANAAKLQIHSSTHEPGGQVVTTLCTGHLTDTERLVMVVRVPGLPVQDTPKEPSP